ncbi:unnamed protein product [Owenia fusiformis]|uniref:EF-hand domain-containing protein n=1 Tax=Owenia fusiformis TaxID=6347 RepID=A0A8S4NH07_OWEFU|nr:unnamed protein product [Owenia fusiformis]
MCSCPIVPCAAVPVRTMCLEALLPKAPPLNAFQKSKLQRKFYFYDIDGDGMIEYEDYKNYIDKIKSVYNLAEGDTLLHAFETEFQAHWSRMLKLMDENKDGQLSMDEWMDYYPRVTQTFKAKTYDNLPTFLQTMADAMFQIMDAKKDGYIDADEYREFWGKIDPPSLEADEARKQIDHMTDNGHYKLTLDRFREVMADFTWSKDEKTIGKYAMGPIRT